MESLCKLHYTYTHPLQQILQLFLTHTNCYISGNFYKMETAVYTTIWDYYRKVQPAQPHGVYIFLIIIYEFILRPNANLTEISDWKNYTVFKIDCLFYYFRYSGGTIFGLIISSW